MVKVGPRFSSRMSVFMKRSIIFAETWMGLEMLFRVK